MNYPRITFSDLIILLKEKVHRDLVQHLKEGRKRLEDSFENIIIPINSIFVLQIQIFEFYFLD